MPVVFVPNMANRKGGFRREFFDDLLRMIGGPVVGDDDFEILYRLAKISRKTIAQEVGAIVGVYEDTDPGFVCSDSSRVCTRLPRDTIGTTLPAGEIPGRT